MRNANSATEETEMQESKRKGLTLLPGAAIAMAAAALFIAEAAVAPASAADDTKVQCIGVNSCKGKSECASAKNGCAGQNACKGQGWLTLTEKDCRTHSGGAHRLP
jgi:uncharacterized membrane protein